MARLADRTAPRAERTSGSGPAGRPVGEKVTYLGKYFEILNSQLKKGATFWFRGHASIEWDLTPSALRYDTVDRRNRAIGLLADFKRYAEMKLERPPRADEELNTTTPLGFCRQA